MTDVLISRFLQKVHILRRILSLRRDLLVGNLPPLACISGLTFLFCRQYHQICHTLEQLEERIRKCRSDKLRPRLPLEWLPTIYEVYVV